MRRWLVALVLLLAVAPTAGGQSLVEHYTRGMQARGAGDFRTYHDEMLAALELEPGHAVLQLHLARACAQLGRLDEARTWLDRALAQGVHVDFREDEWLDPLMTSDRTVEEAVTRLAQEVSLASRAEVGLELGEYDLVPEGMAFDPIDRAFYLSSVHKRKIVRVALDGTSTDFVPPRGDGYLAGLGIAIEAEPRRLWSVSDSFEGSTPLEPGEIGRTYLHCWSLEDGSLLGRWAPPDDSSEHGFNDLCVVGDGEVILTDSTGGALYRARLGSATLSELLAPGTLRGPNGIAYDPERRLLYVSEYVYGISVVDPATAAVERLRVEEPVTTIGTDGLYVHDGTLIAVQNYAGLDRAARFELDASGRSVTGLEILVARHERMDDPTTGALVDGDFWFIANSHVAGFRIDAPVPSVEDWTKVLLLRCSL